MGVFGLRYINPFLFLQLITDGVTINRPGVVDNLIPIRPHLIWSPFLAIVKYMVSQGTAQPPVLVIQVIYVYGIDVASPVTSSATRSAASSSSTLSSSSTHDSVELQL